MHERAVFAAMPAIGWDALVTRQRAKSQSVAGSFFMGPSSWPLLHGPLLMGPSSWAPRAKLLNPARCTAQKILGAVGAALRI